MSILTALNHLYDRMLADGNVARPGFSTEKISFEMVIAEDGRPLYLNDLRNHSNKKPTPCLMTVPAAVDRANNIKSNFLWDKTAYLFGVIAAKDGEEQIKPGEGHRTAREHTEFVASHQKRLEGVKDEGLLALLRFLDLWKPDFFAREGYSIEALDQNIVFRLEGDIGSDDAPRFLHQRPIVPQILEAAEDESKALCLVTGEQDQIARLHRPVKGVMGAQSSGAKLVSFNKPAYDSYGKEQGANAPISEKAAFAYGTALNSLLAAASRRKLRVGDSTVVFWAEAATRDVADFSEMLMGKAFNPPDEATETEKLRENIRKVAEGRGGANQDFDPETKVYLLGLAPNAARLSVRFWHQGRFGDFARNMADFWEDLRIEGHPDFPPWKGPPAVWSLLYETAIRVGDKKEVKADTIPPLLGGEVMRAVLMGQSLPRSLLMAVVRRVRADRDANWQRVARRAAICKAVINRALKSARPPGDETIFEEEMIPVSLDTENTNPAYLLGRLFAVLERAQSAALSGLNATIKDRYFAAASATPARVFPLLVKNATHHIALLKKGGKGGLGYFLEKDLGLIWMGLEADMPRAFNLEDQGRFIAGYYHQRWTPNQDETDDASGNKENDQ